MVSERETAPYAPVNHVLNLIRRLHERGLPDPLTLRDMGRLGVPEGNAPRTLAAIRFLGLIDETGNLTPAADRLQRATSTEYPQALAEILRAAYAPVFAVADPARDSEIAINDAFRHYEPRAQRPRMVIVFQGLCQEAGLVEGGPPPARTRARRAESEGTPITRRPPTTPPARPNQQPESGSPPPAQPPSPPPDGADYRLLSALIQQLPKEAKWSKSRRDRWVQAMTAGVDLLIEVTEEGHSE